MSTVKRGYLALYNSASAIAWLVVLGRVVAVNYFRGPMLVPMVVEEWCRYTQSVAVLEVVHALTGSFLRCSPPSSLPGDVSQCARQASLRRLCEGILNSRR